MGEPEVICPEIQRGVIKGRYSKREVRHNSFYRKARGTVERPDVLYLKEPSGKHGQGAHQTKEVYQWKRSPFIQAKELFYSKGEEQG